MKKSPQANRKVLLSTPLGVFRLEHRGNGIVSLDWTGKGKGGGGPLSPFARKVRSALLSYAAGRPIPARLPLAPEGTPFERQVWAALRRIPFGEVRTYGQIACATERPGAARAVGGACGANPIPVLIPCHRVVAAGGKLGGFSGGLSRKRRLLAIEGHRPEGHGPEGHGPMGRRPAGRGRAR